MSDSVPNRGIRQVKLVHLSDPHFGSGHAFNPELGPDGTSLSTRGVPTFAEILLKDLVQEDPCCPVVIVLTGDVTTKCEDEGFKTCSAFLRALSQSKVFGKVRGLDHVIIVPGNHDIDFGTADPHLKWYRWCKMVKEVYGGGPSPEKPLDVVQLHDFPAEGVTVLTLNSVIYVEKDSPEEQRGHIDNEQLARVNELLSRNEELVRNNIRIAVLHHHPVLIPHLVEASRQYDAVVNSGRLLTILHKYGFHLIVHGHKHWPCTFTCDTRHAYDSAYIRPIVVASGGSVGSKELKRGYDANCYNWVSVKWNSGSDEIRVRVETRGLRRRDERNQEMPPFQWRWETLRVDDRDFYRGDKVPEVYAAPPDDTCSGAYVEEQRRRNEYDRLKNNFPVVEVRPSFRAEQKYEAVFWIVGHSGPEGEDYRGPSRMPVRVTWSAGSRFGEIVVDRETDLRFAGAFEYYGPMLIQAKIEFDHGDPEFAYVYARIPAAGDVSK